VPLDKVEGFVKARISCPVNNHRVLAKAVEDQYPLSSRVDQCQWEAFGLPPPIDSIEVSIMIHVANIPPP
jgi:hypothetical protein